MYLQITSKYAKSLQIHQDIQDPSPMPMGPSPIQATSSASNIFDSRLAPAAAGSTVTRPFEAFGLFEAAAAAPLKSLGLKQGASQPGGATAMWLACFTSSNQPDHGRAVLYSVRGWTWWNMVEHCGTAKRSLVLEDDLCSYQFCETDRTIHVCIQDVA